MNGKRIMAVVEPEMLKIIELVKNSSNGVQASGIMGTENEIKFIVENIEFNLYSFFKSNEDKFAVTLIFKRSKESVAMDERLNAKTLGKIMLMGMSEETEYETSDGKLWHITNLTFDDMSIKDTRKCDELPNGDHYEYYPFFCLHVQFDRKWRK